MKPVELTERILTVLKPIEDLDLDAQKEVLRAALRMIDKKGDHDEPDTTGR